MIREQVLGTVIVVCALMAGAAAGDTFEWTMDGSVFWSDSTSWNHVDNTADATMDDGLIPGTSDTAEVEGGTQLNLDMHTAGVDVLVVSENADLFTAGYLLLVHEPGSLANTAIVGTGGLGNNSQIFVQAGGLAGRSFDTDYIDITDGGELDMDGGVAHIDNYMKVEEDSYITGRGTIVFNDVPDEDDTLLNMYGIIRVDGGTLRLEAPNGGVLDLDGKALGDSLIDVDAGGANTFVVDGQLEDDFSGRMLLGADDTVEFVQAWTANTYAPGSEIAMNPGSSGQCEIKGGDFTLTGVNGKLNVNSGTGVVSSSSFRVESGAIVTVSGADTVLHVPNAFHIGSGANLVVNDGILFLTGVTNWNGPTSVTGTGEIQLNHTAVITDNTTIDVAVFDWDGAGSSFTSINPGNTLTINSEIGSAVGSPGDAHQGRIDVAFDARLVVNDPTDWVLNAGGELNLNGTTGTARLEGSAALYSRGEVNINSGTGAIFCDMTAVDGTVNVANGATIHLRGNTVNIGPPAQFNFATGNTTLRVGGLLSEMSTLTIGQTTPWDWDGPSNETSHETVIGVGSHMIINSDLADEYYDGTLTVLGELEINCPAGDYSVHAAGTLNLNTPTPSADGEIRGTADLDITGTLNVGPFGGEISLPVSFESCTVNMNTNSNTFLRLTGATNYIDSTIVGNGNISQDGNAGVAGDTTINLVGAFDMDGAGENSSFKWWAIGNLTLNVNSLDGSLAAPDNEFNGKLDINAFSRLNVNTAAGAWTMAGILNFNDDSSGVAGDDIIVTGDVNVNHGDVSPVGCGMIFESSANVRLGHGDLWIYEYSTFRGGSFTDTGIGSLVLNGFTVEADTTTNVTRFDFDGFANSETATINANQSLTVNSRWINYDFASDEFDNTTSGTLNLQANASLTINSSDPWTMAGNLNMHGGATVNGTPVIIVGNVDDISGPGVTAYHSPVTFSTGAHVTIAAGNVMRLYGATTFDGGNFAPTGVLEQHGHATVVSDTTVDTTRYNWDAGADVRLTVKSGARFFVSTEVPVFDDTMVVENTGFLVVNDPGEANWTLGPTGELEMRGMPVAAPEAAVGGSDILVNYGTVRGNGRFYAGLINHGLLDPGLSAGSLRIYNNLVLAPDGTVKIELAKGPAFTGYDRVTATGTVLIDGELDLRRIKPYVPALGDSMLIVNTGGYSGTFAETTNVVYSSLLGMAVRYEPMTVHVRVSVRGDTDYDDDVDITDFNRLAGHFDPGGANPHNMWSRDNFDGDRDIDITDFNVLAGNFNPSGYDSGEAVDLTVAADPGQVDLIVDLDTGEVTLDGNAAAISGLQVFSAGNSLLTTDFTAKVLQFVISTNASTYAEGAFIDTAVNGQVSLGILYDLLVDAQDVTFEYTMIGQPTVQGTVIYIPEPASLMLMGMGGLLVLRRRAP